MGGAHAETGALDEQRVARCHVSARRAPQPRLAVVVTRDIPRHSSVVRPLPLLSEIVWTVPDIACSPGLLHELSDLTCPATELCLNQPAPASPDSCWVRSLVVIVIC